MKHKIIEGDGPKRGRSFLINVVRIIIFVVLWNLFLNSDFFQNTTMGMRVIYFIIFLIVLEGIIQLVLRMFRRNNYDE